MNEMTRSEREDLQRLVRQREKVLKSGAKQRSKALLADFESQIAAEYRFDDDAVWDAAAKAAGVEVRKAQERVAARCQELGIPKQFAPSLDLSWSHRGYGNALAERRAELRRCAQAQIESMEQAAIVNIEMDIRGGPNPDRHRRTDIGCGAEILVRPAVGRIPDAGAIVSGGRRRVRPADCRATHHPERAAATALP